MKTAIKIGIVQEGPVYFDKVKSVKKAQDIMIEAGAENVDLLVFGESWLSGYPVWLDYTDTIARWDHPVTKKLFRRMYENSIKIPDEETFIFSKFAKKFGYTIVLGCYEIVAGTNYNSVITFLNDGTIANHHRKLVPAFTGK